jgi:hypothetical protein
MANAAKITARRLLLVRTTHSLQMLAITLFSYQ